MQTYFSAEKSIRMSELFDGRLEAHGVRETIQLDTSETSRFLTDREGGTLLVCGDDSNVEFCLGKGKATGHAILDVIRKVFDTRIFDGDVWITAWRPTGPIRLADMIDGRLAQHTEDSWPIKVVEVLRRPDGTPRSAKLCGSQGLLWVHANDDGVVEYADSFEQPDQNCGAYFVEDIERVFGHGFEVEREEVRRWSTSPLNRYGTRWRAELWYREPQTPEEEKEAAEIQEAHAWFEKQAAEWRAESEARVKASIELSADTSPAT
jgi:hypothetical protein